MITNKPLVCAFASEDHFLSVTVDSPRKLEKCSARRVYHRSFRGGNQFWIRRNCVLIPKLLYNRLLCADVPRRQTSRIELIKLRIVYTHSVRVDCRPVYMAGQRQNHARIDTTGKIGANRDVSAQPF